MADQNLQKQRQITIRHVETETLYDEFSPDNTTGEKALFDIPKGTRVLDGYVHVRTPYTGTTWTASLIADDGANTAIIAANLPNGNAASFTRFGAGVTDNQYLFTANGQIKLNVTVATGLSGTPIIRVLVVVKRESAI